jgi:hypothetical protein
MAFSWWSQGTFPDAIPSELLQRGKSAQDRYALRRPDASPFGRGDLSGPLSQ